MFYLHATFLLDVKILWDGCDEDGKPIVAVMPTLSASQATPIVNETKLRQIPSNADVRQNK